MKIALIALSGVRVKSDELRELGVSLPGFVERGNVIASLPSLGLLTLAGATPDDIELAYYEHGDISADELEAAGFDLVVLSTFTAQAPEAYAFADACRALDLRVAIGGLHVSVRPDEASAHADHVFVGEGEEIWTEFLADFARGEAKPRYDSTGRVYSLADSPLPRYDLLDVERYNRITIQTTRSCPHRCTFCASGILLRGPYRKKPLELVVRAFDRDFAVNGPSTVRIVRTTLAGWKRYKDHPDPRIRRQDRLAHRLHHRFHRVVIPRHPVVDLSHPRLP